MRIRFVHALTAALVLVAAYGGIRFEDARIQSTCEADEGATWINGTPYLCLNQRQIQQLRSQQHERGA